MSFPRKTKFLPADLTTQLHAGHYTPHYGEGQANWHFTAGSPLGGHTNTQVISPQFNSLNCNPFLARTLRVTTPGLTSRKGATTGIGRGRHFFDILLLSGLTLTTGEPFNFSFTRYINPAFLGSSQKTRFSDLPFSGTTFPPRVYLNPFTGIQGTLLHSPGNFLGHGTFVLTRQRNPDETFVSFLPSVFTGTFQGFCGEPSFSRTSLTGFCSPRKFDRPFCGLSSNRGLFTTFSTRVWFHPFPFFRQRSTLVPLFTRRQRDGTFSPTWGNFFVRGTVPPRCLDVVVFREPPF